VGNIRFSLAPGNSEDDVEYLLEILPGIIQRLRDTSASS
jgi:cysteine sulfinate desulfinase/cysteine desulfurase-like protein